MVLGLISSSEKYRAAHMTHAYLKKQKKNKNTIYCDHELRMNSHDSFPRFRSIVAMFY